MNTFFEYIEWRGDLSFDVVPFNEVDAAILARLIYMPFDICVSSDFDKSSLVSDACEEMLNTRYMEEQLLSRDIDLKFIKAIRDSRRFGGLYLTGFVSRLNIDAEYQFAAGVFDLGKNNYYLCYRGTDKNLVGWKEDLNMGVVFPVPAQHMALEYFENAAISLPEGEYIIGGHSKGGNLAVYAAAFSNIQCQSMVKEIYNFDGPGFNEDVMEMLEYQSVKLKINTFVPQFSVVGMILDRIEDYSVVCSDNVGILQHELYSWGVGRDSFILKEKVDSGSRFIDHTLKDWLSKLDTNERSEFVDTLFDVLTAGDATVAEDLLNGKNVAQMFKVYAKMDAKTRKSFNSVLVSLAMSAGSTASSAVGNKSFVVADKVVRRIGRKKGV
ncbi:MAG: DUF2974 domain-containing protein [Saccharofermentans sp.]|nr:DUF2974 domain-containing protein [Saccharofermentans sp.]